MTKLVLILITLSILCLVSTQQKTYTHKVFSDDPDLYVFSWRVLDESKLEITMDCRTTGWVGFGVSKYGFMRNSDIILAYIDENDKPVAFDMYADDYFKPTVDLDRKGESNIEVVSGTKKDGRTKITVIRPMNNGDAYDLKIGKGQAINVIFAYKAGSAALTQHTDMAKHQLILWPDTTTTKVDLIDVSYRTDNSLLNMRVRFDNYPVEIKNQTNYTCKMFKISEAIAQATKLPETTSYHMTAYEPILIGNPSIVHHMIIYSCDPSYLDKFREDYFECYEMPPGCTSLVALQGLGSGPVVYPSNVGVRWGTYESSIVALQMHYELPANFDGKPVKDSSGFDIYFTTKLRTYDAGLLLLGPPHDLLAIPPKTEDFYVSDTCSCLGDSLKDDEITVFAFALHGHKILDKIRNVIKHRDGTEDTSMEYMQYDFNKQSLMTLQEYKKIRKGDTIVTECWFDSMNRTTVTKGGLTSDDEMCYSFLFYYPRGIVTEYCNQYTPCDSRGPLPRVESNVELNRNTMKFSGTFNPDIIPTGDGIVIKGIVVKNSDNSSKVLLPCLFLFIFLIIITL